MSGIVLPKILMGFDVVFNGEDYAGKCEKFKLPKNSPILEVLKAGGFTRGLKVKVGESEDWSAEFTTKGLDLGLLTSNSCTPDDQIIKIYGSLKDGDSCNESAFEATFWGQIEEADPGESSTGELGENSVKFAPARIEYKLNGVEIYYEDIMGMVRRINGVDVLEQRRNNLARK